MLATRLKPGVTKNMWRRTQSGLYAPDRAIVPSNNLSLYLPLWHPELNGSTIVSKDLGARTFTVTGATWGITGRTSAGTDDDISIASDNWLPLTNAPRTIAIWFRTSTVGATVSYLFSYGLWGTDKAFWGINRNTDKITIAGYNETHAGTYIISINTWYLLFVSMTTTGLATFFFSPTAFLVGDINEAHTYSTQAGGKTTLLARNAATPVNNLDGITGDVAAWAQTFSGPERTNFWNKTRWRYM